MLWQGKHIHHNYILSRMAKITGTTSLKKIDNGGERRKQHTFIYLFLVASAWHKYTKRVRKCAWTFLNIKNKQTARKEAYLCKSLHYYYNDHKLNFYLLSIL